MPDFEVQITSGAQSLVWSDPATVDEPSRLNPDPEHPERYASVLVTNQLVIEAVVGGVVGPADGTLGGRLFKWSWVELAKGVALPIPNPAGFTSRAVFPANLFALRTGHYVLLAWRDQGGSMMIPFDIVDP